MNDFAEFYRHSLDNHDFHTCTAVKYWKAMSGEDLAAIRKKWQAEDKTKERKNG